MKFFPAPLPELNIKKYAAIEITALYKKPFSIQPSAFNRTRFRTQITNSDCRMAECRVLNAALLSCFDLRRNQTDLIDSRSVRNINYLRHIRERNLVIALNEHHTFRSSLKDVGQTLPKMIPSLVILVDFERRTLSRRTLNHLDDNGPIIGLL